MRRPLRVVIRDDLVSLSSMLEDGRIYNGGVKMKRLWVGGGVMGHVEGDIYVRFRKRQLAADVRGRHFINYQPLN
jgi:hypothetical protein